ncbi:hypothetical protein [Amycolatopsis sp. NPDC058986]|uniref:hypothetical protein n=1 Tax=unclassified Amycolatopsis TaxID=2618356 RepID=UPI00366B2C5B
MMGRTRLLLGVTGAVLALGLATTVVLVRGESETPTPVAHSSAASLDSLVADFTGALSAGQPYRPPGAAERRAGQEGFTKVLDAGHATSSALDGLGFSVRDGVDAKTGRPYTIAVNESGTERAWGMYVIDRSAPPSLVVEVPHPAFDLHTELAGLDQFRQVPGAVLMIAGAHRKAGGGKADVAHEESSMFHVIATTLMARKLAQVQLHGFDDDSQPGTDIVLSTGAGKAGDPAFRAADRLIAHDFVVCPGWAQTCPGLEAKTNVQGKAAAAAGTVFLHVEMSRTVRDSATRRADVVRALTEAKPGS